MAGQRVVSLFGFYVLQADEIGVKMTLGKLDGMVQPGLGWASPIIQRVTKTKNSLQTIDLPDQQIVLNGNIAITISGNLNFRVNNPERALLKVSDYRYTIQQFSMTTISDVLGTKTIEDVRNEKVTIAQEIENIVAERAEEWGLSDVDIRLTDARLDESLLRAMMRETEAKKEATATQIRADADKLVARTFAEAAETLASSPGAMTLRILQSMTDMSNQKSTIVLPLPWDILGGQAAKDAKAVASIEPSVPAEAPASSLEPSSEPASIPVCKLTYSEERTMAECPHCFVRYNVTDVMGDMRFDRMPEVPGIQVQCKRCQTIFTLPASD